MSTAPDVLFTASVVKVQRHDLAGDGAQNAVVLQDFADLKWT